MKKPRPLITVSTGDMRIIAQIARVRRETEALHKIAEECASQYGVGLAERIFIDLNKVERTLLHG